MTPRQIVDAIERQPDVPAGEGDRFAGYAVVGQPFRSGHVLALRRFPASSIGPAFTSVWHRDPRGRWTFYASVPPELACARYFGRHVHRAVTVPIAITWLDDTRFEVSAGSHLTWEVSLRATFLSRVLGAAARRVGPRWWRIPLALQATGAAARLAFGTGRLDLLGLTPSGHAFIAAPRALWLVDSSRASVEDVDLGPTGPLPIQASLRDVRLPQVGLFAVTSTVLWRPARRPAPGEAGALQGDPDPIACS